MGHSGRDGRRHNGLTQTKLSIALENYRTWAVPTFTTYFHLCKSGCRRVTGILFRMCDFWVVSHKYSTDIIHESGCIYQ
ncbi:hypothetical protein P692DRAFT_20841840 [Suillus brevipes Sb2]|nr:hypothetical protein P692DRAFT_20841840 [Suillus brevipes Sb2]